MRGFATVAAFGSLGAIIFSGEAERYAQGHRPGLPLTSMPLTSMPKPDSAGLSEANPKGLDYAATDPSSRFAGARLLPLDHAAEFQPAAMRPWPSTRKDCPPATKGWEILLSTYQ